MILEHQGPLGDVLLAEAAGGAADGEAVMDEDAVEAQRQFRVPGLVAGLVELRGGEVDVVGLPFAGGEAGVGERDGLLVDAGADVLVAGSAIFKAPDPEAEVLALKALTR